MEGPYGERVADGIRQFIVGTGGKTVRAAWNDLGFLPPEDQDDFHPHTATARLDTPNGLKTFGVLQMVLYDRPIVGGQGSYSWQFAAE